MMHHGMQSWNLATILTRLEKLRIGR